MTLDYLVKAREKQKNQEVAYLIPYNCILLGKKLIQKAEYFELSQVLTNKNLITKSDIEDLQKQGKKTPVKYYQPFKVCYQCYQIYSFIMRSHRLIPSKPVSLKNIKVKQIKNTMESELGILNKDNIDDLLLDMSFYLTSSEMNCDDRVKNLYASMTELNLSRNNDETKLQQGMFRTNYRDPSNKTAALDLIPAIPMDYPKNVARRKMRVLSKVGEFYLRKPKRIDNRLVIK